MVVPFWHLAEIDVGVRAAAYCTLNTWISQIEHYTCVSLSIFLIDVVSVVFATA